MADETGVKVSQLPLGENLADDDLMYAVESGISKKVEVSYLQNRIVGDVDSTPTADSGNLVSSGGVYNMVHTLDFNVFHDMVQISNSIADAFSASESYSEGDYVVYDYSLYKFTADKSAGAWDSSKATPVAVVEELGSGGTTVVPNPSGEATDTLKKLQIDQTIYDFAASNVYGEASGAIASFADGSANPLKSLVVDINPVQAGSGTPSPDNVRPISGWEGANVTVAGKNLANLTYGDKVPSISTGEMVSSYGWSSDFLKLDKNTTYVLSSNLASRYVLFYDKDKTYLGYTVNYSSTGYVLNNSTYWNNTSYIKLRVDASSTATMDVQLEVGSTATSYEAYNADTETISLGQTVYGGKLNVTTGELTVDRYLYSFTGNESFLSNPSAWGDYAFLYNTGVNLKSSFSTLSYCKSSHLDSVDAGGWGSLTPNTFMIAGNTYMGIGFDGTAEELKAWLAAQNTANTPVQILGVLATPTTIELTPTQISSLLGSNNIWADSGDSDVVYIHNLNLFLNQLDARVKALENA